MLTSSGDESITGQEQSVVGDGRAKPHVRDLNLDWTQRAHAMPGALQTDAKMKNRTKISSLSDQVISTCDKLPVPLKRFFYSNN